MIGKRDGQGGLFRPDHVYLDHVGKASFYGLLARHGGEWFRDEDYEELYRKDFGRPSVPPSQLCIALMLQTHDGVSDEEAIHRSAYDLRWKVSLGLELDEKLCAKSTLQLFRAKLIIHEKYEQVFEASIEACRKGGLLKRRRLEAAVDTTPVLGRGAVKDTYNLVSDQIRKVVKEACELKGWEQETIVAEHGLGRHFKKSFKGSVQLDWSDPAERRALLAQLVADARVAVELSKKALRGFVRSADKTRALREAQALLSDLLQQDIEEAPDDGGGPQIRQGTARDRVVSTTDPEMRHGHKSHSKAFNGYKASVVVSTEASVILGTDVIAANVADKEGAAELLEKSAKRAQQPLKRAIGDTAYGTMDAREKVERLGAEMIAKAPPAGRKGLFTLNDFRIQESRGVARCPAGKKSRRRDRVTGPDPGWRYVFSRKDCSPCPLRAKCTRAKKSARVVQITEKTKQLQPLRRKQKTKHFKQIYRRRIVVEHRIARLEQLGVRQARYLGKAKVAFQVAMAATVANLTLVGTTLLSELWHLLAWRRRRQVPTLVLAVP